MKRRTDIILAVVFLTVALLAMYNTWQFQRYTRATIARDTAQEHCQLDTLVALRLWTQQRVITEVAAADRDRASLAAFEDIRDGRPVTVEQAQKVIDAINTSVKAREGLIRQSQENPLPVCRLG